MGRGRKIIHRVVVYGLIGLVVNVLVAWGFAAWGEVRPIRAVTTTEAYERVDHVPSLEWRAYGGAAESPSPNYEQYYSGVGLQVFAQRDLNSISAFVTVVESGWPLASMRSARFAARDQDASWQKRRRFACIDLPTPWPVLWLDNWWPERRGLPIVPVRGSFVFNTVFFALVTWVVIAVYARWIADRRARRGRCPMCAYDLREEFGGGCSECGWGRDAMELGVVKKM